MIILLIFTIGTHSMIRSAYEREFDDFAMQKHMLTPHVAITNYLPMDIATIDAAERYKQENENELYRGEMDLFSRDREYPPLRPCFIADTWV